MACLFEAANLSIHPPTLIGESQTPHISGCGCLVFELDAAGPLAAQASDGIVTLGQARARIDSDGPTEQNQQPKTPRL